MPLVFSYGALSPTENADFVEHLLRCAYGDRSANGGLGGYYNRLVEIERRRRRVYREIEQSVVPAAVVETRDKTSEAVETTVRAIRDARGKKASKADLEVLKEKLKAAKAEAKEAQVKYREQTEPLRRAGELLKEAREREKRSRKEAGKRDRNDAEIADILHFFQAGNPEATIALRMHDNDSTAATEVRKARAASSLPWGVYVLVEEAVNRAMDPPPPPPGAARRPWHELPAFKRYTGEGRVGSPQLVGGLTSDKLEADTRFRIRVLPPPAGRPASKRLEKRRFAEARIRLGYDTDGEVIWGCWPFLMHRPIPEGAKVLQAWALRRRVGSGWKWSIQLTLDTGEAAVKAKKEQPSAVAIDLGWRASAGYRVGYMVDDMGSYQPFHVPAISFAKGKARRRQWDKMGRVTAPAAKVLIDNDWKLPMAKALEYLDGIRAVRDKCFDLAIGFVRTWLEQHAENLPEWLKEATSTLALWHGHGRLVGLYHKWSKAPVRVEGDEVLLEGLRAWKSKDRHLWDWEAHGRERILRARREHYRVIAARLTETYDVIVLPKIDLRDFAMSPPAENGPSTEGTELRRIRAVCAPSELRNAIRTAAKHRGCEVIEVDADKDTMTCHRCGEVGTWDSAANVVQQCETCGMVFDQDANGCINRLRKAGFDNGKTIVVEIKNTKVA